jgi:hypothetical protein
MPRIKSDVITYEYTKADLELLLAKELDVSHSAVTVRVHTDYDGYVDGLEVEVDKRKDK